MAASAAEVISPHPVTMGSDDFIWSFRKAPYNQTNEDGSVREPQVVTARFWTSIHVPPGRAFVVDGLDRRWA